MWHYKFNVFHWVWVLFDPKHIFHFHRGEELSAGDVYGYYYIMKTLSNYVSNLSKGQRTFMFKVL